MRAHRLTLALLSLLVGAPALGLPFAVEETVLLPDSGAGTDSSGADRSKRKKKKGGEEDEEDFVPRRAGLDVQLEAERPTGG